MNLIFVNRGRATLGALLLCSVVLTMTVSQASARPHHSGRYATSHHAKHIKHVKHRAAYRVWHGRHQARLRAPQAQGFDAAQNFANANASMGSSSQGFGGGGLVSQARSYIGGNPTGRGRLWCARFMNMVLEQSGHRGTGSDMARSFADYGSRVSGPQIGAIAVMSRGKRGGHVGVVSGIDEAGNPIVISGNNGNRVRESAISRGRIYAYVMPN